MFEPGEWCVLKHTDGARAFLVHSCEKIVNDRGHFYMVQEAEGEQLRVRAKRLVKMASKKDVDNCIAVIRFINAEFDESHAKLLDETRNRILRAIDSYELFTEESDDQNQ